MDIEFTAPPIGESHVALPQIHTQSADSRFFGVGKSFVKFVYENLDLERNQKGNIDGNLSKRALHKIHHRILNFKNDRSLVLKKLA